MLSKSIRKSYILWNFLSSNRSNFKGPGKVLANFVFEFYQSIKVQLYQSTLVGWLSPLHVYKWATVSEKQELLSISLRRKGDFVAHFCQLFRDVFENKMTYCILIEIRNEFFDLIG